MAATMTNDIDEARNWCGNEIDCASCAHRDLLAQGRCELKRACVEDRYARRIDRFFDPRYEQEAGIHNQTVLAALAEDILNTPQEMRRRAFAGRCADAIERYGQLGGFTTVVSPHSQLSQWAQYY